MQKGRVAINATRLSLSKNLFFDRLTEVKGAFKPSKPHPSAYMDTVGGGLRRKSKGFAQQIYGIFIVCSLYHLSIL